MIGSLRSVLLLVLLCYLERSVAQGGKDVTKDVIEKLADIGVTKLNGKLKEPEDFKCSDGLNVGKKYLASCASSVDEAVKEWFESAAIAKYPGAENPLSKCPENKVEDAFLWLVSTSKMTCFQERTSEDPSTSPKVEDPTTPKGEVPVPATTAKGGEVPATPAKGGEVPATPAKGGEAPATPAKGGEAPATPAKGGEAPATPAKGGEAPATPAKGGEAPATPAKGGEAPATPAKGGEAPATPAKGGEAPATPAKGGEAPATPAKGGEAPATPAKGGEAPATPAKGGEAPATPAKGGEAPATPAKGGEAPATPAKGGEAPATPAKGGEAPATPAKGGEAPATPAKTEETDKGGRFRRDTTNYIVCSFSDSLDLSKKGEEALFDQDTYCQVESKLKSKYGKEFETCDESLECQEGGNATEGTEQSNNVNIHSDIILVTVVASIAIVLTNNEN